jgi:hypothetical protein
MYREPVTDPVGVYSEPPSVDAEAEVTVGDAGCSAGGKKWMGKA